jgi:hypothetical protein
MIRFGKIVVCFLGGLVLNTGLGADNPYVPIVDRNIFGLNPPQVVAPTAPPEPPSTITPNGIMTIFGTPQVLFKVAVPPRPPEPAKEVSCILGEGERQDDIEVTHIDQAAGVVTFNNHGVVQEIPLVKAPPITTPTPVVMNSGFVPPGAAYGGYRGPGDGNSLPPGNGPDQSSNMGNNSGNFEGNNGNASGANYGANPGSAPATPQLSPEEQMIMIAAQHAKAQQEGDPIARIFPPTPLDDAAGVAPPSDSTPSP